MKTTTVSGYITLNGATPTANAQAYSLDTTAVVQLTETTYGYTYTIDVAVQDNFAWSATVYTGTYKVTVAGGGYSNLPYETFVARTALGVASPTSNVQLDMKTTTVAGYITLNGAAPVANAQAYSLDTTAVVQLTETTFGYTYTIDVPVQDNFTFSAVVYPGTYRVTVAGGGYSNLPYDTMVAKTALGITGPTSNVQLDVKTTTVSGYITLNGVAPTANAQAYSLDTTAVVQLIETTFGYTYTIDVAVEDNFSFSAVVYPGTYKVTVAGGGYSNLPYETMVVKTALGVTGPTSNVQLDVRTTTVSGSITLNGAAPTANAQAYSLDTTAVVQLTETTFGYTYTIDVAVQDNFTFSETVYPGTYKVTVAGGGYSNLPYETYVARTALGVTGPTSNVQLDVKTTTVSGYITLNGAAPVANAQAYSLDTTAVVQLTETTFGYTYTIDVAVQDSFTFSETVYPGTYRVTVAGGGYSNLPYETFVALTGLGVSAPTSNVQLNVPTASVCGTITLNGAAPTVNPQAYSLDTTAVVQLTETTYGYTYTIDVAVQDDFVWMPVIYPGTYQITVAGGGYSNLPYETFVAQPSIALP